MNMKERIAVVIAHLDNAKATVEQLEEQLTDAKAVVRRLEESVLPDLLDEIGAERLTVNGRTLELNGFPVARPENRDAAIHWLLQHDYKDIVDKAVKVTVDDITDLDRISEEFPGAEVKLSVHPQRLNAFVRELMERGETLPQDIFNIDEVKKVKVK